MTLDDYTSTYAELSASIDWDKVRDAMVGDKPIMDFDLEDALLCVHAACERWLLQDKENFIVTGLESKIQVTDPGFKAYKDIEGMVVADPVKQLKAYAGKPYIVDWKTAKGDLDKRWKDRLLLSTQWRQYWWAQGGGEGLFVYRGIRRPNAKGEVQFRELMFDPSTFTRNNEALTKQQLYGIMAMRDTLINEDFPIWPMNMPAACHDYGEDCPYLNDCDLGDQPRWVPPHGKVMSYSRLKSFLRCPERSRRELLDETEGDADNGSDATRFGNCVHRGLAEVYSQVFKVPVSLREEIEVEKEDLTVEEL